MTIPTPDPAASESPLFLQTRQYILSELQNLSLKAGDKIPSENVFCRKSKVSIRTVRRALEELEKERIIFRRQGLGSFLREAGAASKTNPASLGTVGILFSDMDYLIRPMFSQLLRAAEACVLEQGYAFHLYSTGNRQHPDEKRPLEQLIPLDKVKGLIATSALNMKDIQTLRRHKIPLVTFNEYKHLRVNSVIFDYYAAARLGIAYLRETGHENIAFICRRFSPSSSPVIYNNDNFLRGIKDAFAENGLRLDERVIFQSDSRREDGRDIADSLFKSAFPPDAIFTIDDFLAQGVFDAMKKTNAGCTVLNCGIDGSAVTTTPTILIPAAAWGQAAVDLLFRTINGDMSIKKTKWLKPELSTPTGQIRKAM